MSLRTMRKGLGHTAAPRAPAIAGGMPAGVTTHDITIERSVCRPASQNTVALSNTRDRGDVLGLGGMQTSQLTEESREGWRRFVPQLRT